ncbi:MAG: VWA domain-containing protein [Candidatus Riflebacteria bacterium]|nr:VWA domain-containing protein [Candidatus Riflebacteria bacterium]
MNRLKRWGTLVPLLTLLAASPLAADQTREERVEAIMTEGMETNLVVIADTSGSMAERPASGGSRSKIDIAREALARFLSTLPKAVRVGMVIYDGCDTRIVAALDTATRESVVAEVDRLPARGKTPIVDSLSQALEQLKPRLEKNPYGRNVVLLVTDGEETCKAQGMVREAAARLTDGFIELIIIGFDLPSQDTDLKQVATRYYLASDSRELSEGLATVQGELAVDATVDTIPGTPTRPSPASQGMEGQW